MEKINIIIPTLNEHQNIFFLLKKIRKYLKTAIICIVDDSKNDKTEILLRKKKIKNLLYFHRIGKKGRGSAVLFGFKKILSNKKDSQIFVEMDADFSHNPIELKKNLLIFKKNKSDLLISSRYLKQSKIINWTISRRIFSFLANKLANFFLRCNVSDYTNGYRIYSKRAVQLILKKCGKIGDGFIVLSEIILILKLKKYRIHETFTKFENRRRGESSVNLKLILNSLYGLIKLIIKKNTL